MNCIYEYIISIENETPILKINKIKIIKSEYHKGVFFTGDLYVVDDNRFNYDDEEDIIFDYSLNHWDYTNNIRKNKSTQICYSYLSLENNQDFINSIIKKLYTRVDRQIQYIDEKLKKMKFEKDTLNKIYNLEVK